MSEYSLRLYISRRSASTERAIGKLRWICREVLRGRYELDPVEVPEPPSPAEAVGFLAKSVIRELPGPLQHAILDLRDREKVLLGVDLRPRGLPAVRIEPSPVDLRMTSGNVELDAMCGGGLFRDSLVLVCGAAGTGKTRVAAEFVAAGVANGERALVFSFEEGRAQFLRNALGWGIDFDQMERDGSARLTCAYPKSARLDAHLATLQSGVESFRPNRVAVDGLTALESTATECEFRNFFASLRTIIKRQEAAGLFTVAASGLMCAISVTDVHISSMADCIILLRNADLWGEMRRGISVLKMRGSMHDKEIREFTIDATGMHVGEAFRNITGVLCGNAAHVELDEAEAMDYLLLEREAGAMAG